MGPMTGIAAGAAAKKAAKDLDAKARKKRMEMPADEYGKMIDRTQGESKGRLKGDFNEEPDMMSSLKDTAKAYGRAYKEGMGMKKGGSVGSASKRADGCAKRGKTKGRMV